MLNRSFKAVLLASLLSTAAYAGDERAYGGKNTHEERVFLDDLQVIEDTDQSLDALIAPSQASEPLQPIYAPPPVVTPAEANASAVEDKTDNRLKPRVEFNHRYSNDRAISMGEFWVPLAQDEQEGSVLFGDVRIMGDNNANDEYNAGLGYRKIIETKLLGEGVAGGMVWLDRRHTARGSKFNQITTGLEWLGEQYDVRLNGYVPLNSNKNHTQANPNGSGLGFVGNQILVNTDQSVVEEALPGLDLELGTRINFLDGITDATRVYAGAYHFEGDRAEDVTG